MILAICGLVWLCPFPHPTDPEGQEAEALVDVDHAGFLLRRPQPQWGQNAGCLFSQCLGVSAGGRRRARLVLRRG
jgi:hypothetical protein